MEVGAGVLTAAALAAAGAYLLSTKGQRAKAKAWAVKARKEVAANVRRARTMSQAEYKRVVDQAMKRYGSLSNANKAELLRAAQDMKSEWQNIKKNAHVIAKMAQGKKPAKKKR